MSKTILHITIPDTPPSGNRLTRMHWAARAKLEREWGRFLYSVWVESRAGAAFVFEADRPAQGKRRRLTVIWSAPKPPDHDNALQALKGTVIDRMKARRRKRTGGVMVQVPGLIPVIWDDDPDHLEVVYVPAKAKTRKLEIVVEEVGV